MSSQRYYGYRLHQHNLAEDPRLSLLDPTWFRGRRVLDVGCNEGLVSIGVAAKFHARCARDMKFVHFVHFFNVLIICRVYFIYSYLQETRYKSYKYA